MFLPIKPKTSFIKSLKPRWEDMNIMIQSLKTGDNCLMLCVSLWTTLICQVQCRSVLSSVILQNNLIDTGILFGNLTRKVSRSDSHMEQNAAQEICLAFIRKGKLSLLLWMLQITHVWHKSKKADRQNRQEWFKTRAFSGRTAKPEAAVGSWRQQITVPNF